jgi:putative ABC transport system ATP-binding protein
MIRFENVTKVFGAGPTAVRAVDDLSLEIPTGDFWSLMGPSGSGKSTVLNLIAGLTPPDSGRIFVGDVDISHLSSADAARLRRRRIGYVLQSSNLLPFFTAAENVGMPLVLDGVPQREVDTRVREALELVDMSHRAPHKPSELSGGEQQRVAIARALVIRPMIVLADEPTGNLDRAGGRAVMNLIQDINARTGVTVLMVTHDPIFAACAKRVLRLVDGKLDQDISLLEEHDEPGHGADPDDEQMREAFKGSRRAN